MSEMEAFIAGWFAHARNPHSLLPEEAWHVYRDEPTTPLHVVPTGDQIEHTLDDACPCGPTSEPVKRDDGSVGWIFIHHSLDGREQSEEPTHE